MVDKYLIPYITRIKKSYPNDIQLLIDDVTNLAKAKRVSERFYRIVLQMLINDLKQQGYPPELLTADNLKAEKIIVKVSSKIMLEEWLKVALHDNQRYSQYLQMPKMNRVYLKHFDKFNYQFTIQKAVADFINDYATLNWFENQIFAKRDEISQAVNTILQQQLKSMTVKTVLDSDLSLYQALRIWLNEKGFASKIARIEAIKLFKPLLKIHTDISEETLHNVVQELWEDLSEEIYYCLQTKFLSQSIYKRYLTLEDIHFGVTDRDEFKCLSEQINNFVEMSEELV